MKKNKDLSSIASVAAVLALLLWVGTSVVVWRSPVEGAPQNPKRMLRRDHPSEGEPVVITKVTVEGNEVKFKKEFDAGNDWYKSLAITVENRSGKPLVYMQVGLLFKRPSDSTDRLSVSELNYGGSESLALRQGRPQLGPGESVELRFDQQDQAALEEFLSDTGYSSVPQIDVSVRAVICADGSKWELGRWFSKDSKAPTGWSTIKPKQPVYLASAPQRRTKKYSHMEQCLRTERSSGWCPDKQANPLIACGSYATDKESDPDPFASGGYDWLLCTTRSDCKDYLGHAIPGCGSHESLYSASCHGEEECDPACDTYNGYVCIDGYCSDTSPILIDVDGDGFDLTDAVGGVDFDLTNSGFANRISWTAEGSDDAWLALDRNGNGVIDDGSELFGSVTPQSHSGPPNGFNALAEFDKPENGGDHNGLIDRHDAVFLHLLLWQDENHNGVSEVNELHNFASLKLKAIALDYKESKKTDQFGNHFKYRAKVYDTHGSHVGRWAWDVFLLSVGQ